MSEDKSDDIDTAYTCIDYGQEFVSHRASRTRVKASKSHIVYT